MDAATKFSTSNIYVPDGYTFGLNQVPFNSELAWKAIEVSGKPEALQAFYLWWEDLSSLQDY